MAVGETPSSGLLSLTAWREGFRSRRLFEDLKPSPACPACAGRGYPALEASSSDTVKLCGRQSVQITPLGRARPDFDLLETRLAQLGRVRRSPQLLNADFADVSLTIFSDGRCVVRGTDDPARARTYYDRYVGS